MGKVMSSMSRYVRNYNVANRAEKAIEKQRAKPKPPPAYPSTTDALRKVREEHQDFLETESTKDEGLHNRLKDVFVESVGDPVTIRAKERPLPESRETPEDPLFGYLEPNVIKEGRLSLRQAMELLSQHQSNPQQYTAPMAAKDYKLDLVNAQQIVKYFGMFELHVPDKSPGSANVREALPPGLKDRLLKSGIATGEHGETDR